jgi:oxygen-dependent protoporphyrinogen oxidase
MGALSDALAAALGNDLRARAEVRALARRGSQLVVETDDAALEAERVVLALPPREAAAVTRPLEGALGDAFDAIPECALAAVSLGFRAADLPHPLDGFGFLVPRREGLRTLGCIFMTSVFPGCAQAPEGHVLLRCLIGGALDPGALALDDTALVTVARDDLARALAIRARPACAHVVRWPRAIAQYTIGHAERVARIDARGQALGVFATGAALRGVGVNDVVRDAAALAERLGPA